MKLINTLALIGAFFMAVGCAPKKPLTYDSEHSKALNIVKAAKMDYGLKDVEVPKDTVTDFRNSKTYAVAYGAVSYNTPTPGLSSGASAALGVLSVLVTNEVPSARNSIIAWMPKQLADTKEDALEKMSDLLIEATEKAAKDLKYDPKTFIGKNGTDKRGFAIALTNINSDNCKIADRPGSTVSDCMMIYKVRYPQKISNTAAFVGKGPTWFFDPMEGDFTAPLLKNNRDFKYNEFELLATASKYLPEWVYIYLAPGKILISNEVKLKAPLILNKGETHYFIKVKN